MLLLGIIQFLFAGSDVSVDIEEKKKKRVCRCYIVVQRLLCYHFNVSPSLFLFFDHWFAHFPLPDSESMRISSDAPSA